MPEAPNKILVVSLDNLGDTVMVTGVLRPLRRAYPNALIGLWIKDYARELFSPTPYLDTIHSSDPFWDKSPGSSKGSLVRFGRVWNEIRQENYDLAFILRTEWRRSLACLAAGISERVGYDQRKSGPFLTKRVPPLQPQTHLVEENNYLVKSWLGESGENESNDWQPHLWLSDNDREEIHRSRQNGGGERKRIVINPISGDTRKNWPLTRWRELIQLIKGANDSYQVIAIGSKADHQSLAEAFGEFPDVTLLTGETLSRIKIIIAGADLFIGADSGPGHVAMALGIPTISLFAIKNFDRCAARGSGQLKILYHDPIADLSPRIVFDSLTSLRVRL